MFMIFFSRPDAMKLMIADGIRAGMIADGSRDGMMTVGTRVGMRAGTLTGISGSDMTMSKASDIIRNTRATRRTGSMLVRHCDLSPVHTVSAVSFAAC